MNTNIWIDAIGMIDEDIIGEFIEKDMSLTNGSGIIVMPRRRSLSWVTYVAACLCACAVTAVIVFSAIMGGRGTPHVTEPVGPLGSDSTPIEDSTPTVPDESNPEETPPTVPDESNPEETPPPLPDNENLGDPNYSDNYEGDLVFELTDSGEYYKVTSCSDSPTNIVVPEIYKGKYVTEIADSAFSDHRNLQSVTLPDSIRSIGNNAFLNCYLLESIHLSERLEYIGELAFSECRALKSVDLPEYLREIGKEAFIECTSLSKVSFPKGLRVIGESAFENCNGITSVILPDGFESMGKNAFLGCSKITELSVPDSIKSWGVDAFADSKLRVYRNVDGIFYAGNEEAPCLVAVTVQYKALKNIVFAEGCKVVADEAMIEANAYESVYIPKSIEYIGESAFRQRSKLVTVVIEYGSHLKEIGNSAFLACTSMTSINLQDGLESIGDSAFSSCINLPIIELPNSVTYIGNSAFSNCEMLTEFRCPEGLREIPERMLEQCESLTNVYIPESVKSIGSYAFSRTKIAEIVIPGTVKNVGHYAFESCTKLKKLILSEGVEIVGNNIVDRCSAIEEVGIPSSLISIGSIGFENANQISNVPYRPYENGHYVGNDDNHYVIFVRAASKNLSEITVASDCTIIYTSAFSVCAQSLRRVNLPEGITRIGSKAFAGCELLESITIPSTVRFLGSYAFESCDSLKEVVIPDGVEEIPYGLFRYTDLESLTLPGSITKIYEDAISYATDIKFGGTVKEWLAIVEESENREVLEKCTVACIDGTIAAKS